MLPAIALVGRPNVGKSTLFNQLTRSRDALVADQPGVTRDRRYGFADFEGSSYLVIDTGGLGGVGEAEIDPLVDCQVAHAVEEADALVLVVDQHDGATAEDLRRDVAEMARTSPHFLSGLIEEARRTSVALGWFGGLAPDRDDPAHRGAVNLKHRGTLPLVTNLRILALREGILETSSLARLDVLIDVLRPHLPPLARPRRVRTGARQDRRRRRQRAEPSRLPRRVPQTLGLGVNAAARLARIEFNSIFQCIDTTA